MMLEVFNWDAPSDQRKPGVYTDGRGGLLVYTSDGTLTNVWPYQGAEIFEHLVAVIIAEVKR